MNCYDEDDYPGIEHQPCPGQRFYIGLLWAGIITTAAAALTVFLIR